MALHKDNKYRFVKKLRSEDEYRKVADSLIEFVKKESLLDINEFPLSLMINPECFAAFSTQSEYFADAYNNALCVIGARLKRLMYEGVIDRQIALEMLPLYDLEYKKYLKEKKQKDDITPGETKFIVIEMPMFSSSDIPPSERKAEERARSEIMAEEIARRKKEILENQD